MGNKSKSYAFRRIIAQCLLKAQDLLEFDRVITPKGVTLTSKKFFRKIVEQAGIMAVTY
jgi:hypothetical protein